MERVDTGDFKGGRIEAGAGKRLDVKANRLARMQQAVVVEPQQRTVAVHRADGAVDVLREGDVLEGGEVVLGWEVAVAALFA